MVIFTQYFRKELKDETSTCNGYSSKIEELESKLKEVSYDTSQFNFNFIACIMCSFFIYRVITDLI